MHTQSPTLINTGSLAVSCPIADAYYCIVLRRRQSNLALKKLRHSLLHPPAKNALVHTIEAAVTEIKVKDEWLYCLYVRG